MLFHEIYGSYYRATAAILRQAARGALTGRELTALVQRHGFGESLLTIPDALRGERWLLLHRDLSSALTGEPELPLTTLEKRWMKALLLDPRIQLFDADPTGLEEVEPLFTPDQVVCYDRYTNGDDFQDPGYIARFRTILRALREKSALYVRFQTGKVKKTQLVVTPHHLEYSEKDDRFRLVAASARRRWIINLGRLEACALSASERYSPLPEADMEQVTFELTDRRNALERVLLHFSHLEKETKRLDEDRYRVTLRYNREDETEMVIRILSFGPVLRVVEPEHMIALLRRRVERQRQLNPGPGGAAREEG